MDTNSPLKQLAVSSVNNITSNINYDTISRNLRDKPRFTYSLLTTGLENGEPGEVECLGICLSLFRLHRYSEAIQKAKEYFALFPECLDFVVVIMYCFIHMGELEQAYDTTMSHINPSQLMASNPYLLSDVGVLSYSLGRYRESLDCFGAAHRMLPENVTISLNFYMVLLNKLVSSTTEDEAPKEGSVCEESDWDNIVPVQPLVTTLQKTYNPVLAYLVAVYYYNSNGLCKSYVDYDYGFYTCIALFTHIWGPNVTNKLIGCKTEGGQGPRVCPLVSFSKVADNLPTNLKPYGYEPSKTNPSINENINSLFTQTISKYYKSVSLGTNSYLSNKLLCVNMGNCKYHVDDYELTGEDTPETVSELVIFLVNDFLKFSYNGIYYNFARDRQGVPGPQNAPMKLYCFYEYKLTNNMLYTMIHFYTLYIFNSANIVDGNINFVKSNNFTYSALSNQRNANRAFGPDYVYGIFKYIHRVFPTDYLGVVNIINLLVINMHKLMYPDIDPYKLNASHFVTTNIHINTEQADETLGQVRATGSTLNRSGDNCSFSDSLQESNEFIKLLHCKDKVKGLMNSHYRQIYDYVHILRSFDFEKLNNIDFRRFSINESKLREKLGDPNLNTTEFVRLVNNIDEFFISNDPEPKSDSNPDQEQHTDIQDREDARRFDFFNCTESVLNVLVIPVINNMINAVSSINITSVHNVLFLLHDIDPDGTRFYIDSGLSPRDGDSFSRPRSYETMSRGTKDKVGSEGIMTNGEEHAGTGASGATEQQRKKIFADPVESRNNQAMKALNNIFNRIRDCIRILDFCIYNNNNFFFSNELPSRSNRYINFVKYIDRFRNNKVLPIVEYNISFNNYLYHYGIKCTDTEAIRNLEDSQDNIELFDRYYRSDSNKNNTISLVYSLLALLCDNVNRCDTAHDLLSNLTTTIATGKYNQFMEAIRLRNSTGISNVPPNNTAPTTLTEENKGTDETEAITTTTATIQPKPTEQSDTKPKTNNKATTQELSSPRVIDSKVGDCQRLMDSNPKLYSDDVFIGRNGILSDVINTLFLNMYVSDVDGVSGGRKPASNHINLVSRQFCDTLEPYNIVMLNDIVSFITANSLSLIDNFGLSTKICVKNCLQSIILNERLKNIFGARLTMFKAVNKDNVADETIATRMKGVRHFSICNKNNQLFSPLPLTIQSTLSDSELIRHSTYYQYYLLNPPQFYFLISKYLYTNADYQKSLQYINKTIINANYSTFNQLGSKQQIISMSQNGAPLQQTSLISPDNINLTHLMFFHITNVTSGFPQPPCQPNRCPKTNSEQLDNESKPSVNDGVSDTHQVGDTQSFPLFTFSSFFPFIIVYLNSMTLLMAHFNRFTLYKEMGNYVKASRDASLCNQLLSYNFNKYLFMILPLHMSNVYNYRNVVLNNIYNINNSINNYIYVHDNEEFLGFNMTEICNTQNEVKTPTGTPSAPPLSYSSHATFIDQYKIPDGIEFVRHNNESYETMCRRITTYLRDKVDIAKYREIILARISQLSFLHKLKGSSSSNLTNGYSRTVCAGKSSHMSKRTPTQTKNRASARQLSENIKLEDSKFQKQTNNQKATLDIVSRLITILHPTRLTFEINTNVISDFNLLFTAFHPGKTTRKLFLTEFPSDKAFALRRGIVVQVPRLSVLSNYFTVVPFSGFSSVSSELCGGQYHRNYVTECLYTNPISVLFSPIDTQLTVDILRYYHIHANSIVRRKRSLENKTKDVGQQSESSSQMLPSEDISCSICGSPIYLKPSVHPHNSAGSILTSSAPSQLCYCTSNYKNIWLYAITYEETISCCSVPPDTPAGMSNGPTGYDARFLDIMRLKAIGITKANEIIKSAPSIVFNSNMAMDFSHLRDSVELVPISLTQTEQPQKRTRTPQGERGSRGGMATRARRLGQRGNNSNTPDGRPGSRSSDRQNKAKAGEGEVISGEDMIPTQHLEVINVLYMFSDYSTPKTMEYVVNMINNHTSTIKGAMEMGEQKNFVYRVVIYSTISKERFDQNIDIVLSDIENPDTEIEDDASAGHSDDNSQTSDRTTEETSDSSSSTSEMSQGEAPLIDKGSRTHDKRSRKNEVRKHVGLIYSYRDISTFSILEIVLQIYMDRIHFIVDLDGYTKNNFSNVINLGPAPIVLHMLKKFPSFIGVSGDHDLPSLNDCPALRDELSSSGVEYNCGPKFPAAVRYVLGDAAVFGAENDDDPIYSLEEKLITLSSYMSFNFSGLTPVFPSVSPSAEKEYNNLTPISASGSNAIVEINRDGDVCGDGIDMTNNDSETDGGGCVGIRERSQLSVSECSKMKIIQDIRNQAKQLHGLKRFRFVFGCYSNLFKLDANSLLLFLFVLKAVSESCILFIKESNLQEQNIRRFIKRCGFEGFQQRIIFLPATDRSTHLERLQLVDMFFDTPSWSGQWSSAEALYSGIPVLALPSRKICTRLTTSMLVALKCPELIAQNPTQFTDIAIRLATDQRCLNNIRYRLIVARAQSALFDFGRWTSELELAMETCYTRWRVTGSGVSFDINDAKREQHQAVSVKSLTQAPLSVENIFSSFIV